jgi:hypothetical protein
MRQSVRQSFLGSCGSRRYQAAQTSLRCARRVGSYLLQIGQKRRWLAEGEGFEPSRRLTTPNGFRDRAASADAVLADPAVKTRLRVAGDVAEARVLVDQRQRPHALLARQGRPLRAFPCRR